MDVNQAYCGDHFMVYTYITSLCCIPETFIMSYYMLIVLQYKNNYS